MKCENCGKNDVSFVFHSSINGTVEEKHLCHDCAEQLGYAKKLQESYTGMNRLFRSSFAPMGLLSGVSPSPFFGGSLLDDGFFGGSLLDDDFFQPFFGRPGLTAAPAQPETAPEESKLGSQDEQKALCRQREINALRAEMKQAVDSENFERAAQLRDKLRAMEPKD